MPEYRLSLDFTAADDAQAERLAEAWAGTCAAEYGTRYAGCSQLSAHPPGLSVVACDWCGRAIRRVAGAGWWAVKSEERGYDPLICDANPEGHHHEPTEETP